MRIFFILICLICTLVSLSVFFTARAQFNLFYPDKASTKIETLEEFDKQFSLFPNITFAAIPINAIRGTFAINEKKFTYGNDLLNKAQKDNPYIGYTEYVKAKTYFAIGNIDSSRYYAEKAFKKWPKSIDNYTMYLKTLAFEGDTLGIVDAFDFIDDIFRDRSQYAKEFVNFYTNAQLKYLVTEYEDRTNISSDSLQGTWVKCYEYEGGKVQFDNSVRIIFQNNQLISSDNVKYNFMVLNDTLSLYTIPSNNLITKNLISYSTKYNSLILTSDPRTKKVEQFFKKAPKK